MKIDSNSLEINLIDSFKESVPLAFLNFFKNTIELSSNPLIPSIDTIDTQIDKMVDYVKDILISINDVLNEDSIQKYNRIQELITYTNHTSKLFRIAYGYVTELNILTFIVEEQYHLEQFKRSNISALDYNQFYEECYSFVFNNSNPKKINNKLREVLKHIPIRVTKDKFFDYIEKSISEVEIDESPEAIEHFFSLLKQQFIGKSIEGYGVFLPDIASSIDSFHARDLLQLKENEIENLWEEIEIIGDTLTNIINLLSKLFKIFNSLSIFIMLENVNLQTLFNKHIAYRDFYLSTVSIINWAANPEERELLLETLPDLINKHIEILQRNLEKKHMEIIKQIRESDQDLLNNSTLSKEIQSYQLILYHINTDLSDLFSYDKKSSSSKIIKKEIEPYLKELKSFIDNELKNMPNLLRKARMQHFLGIIPPVMEKKEFMNYLQNSIELCSSQERKALVLSKIGNIMDSYGFFDHYNCDCEHEHEYDHPIHNHHHHH